MTTPHWLRLVAYSLPGVPLAVLVLPVYIFVPTLYIQGLGLPPDVVGYILLASRLFDALTDPLMGWISDKTPSSLGRRKLWLLIGMPLTVISVWMLFVPPPDADALYLTIAVFAVTLSWTIAIIPYTAWGAELASDYEGRTRVVALRESFTVIGTLIATAVAGILSQGEDGSVGKALGTIAVIVAVLMPACTIIAALAVPDGRPMRQARVGFIEGLRVMRRNAPFLRLVLAFLINGLANGLPATLFFIFVSARIGAPEWGGPLLFIYFLCGIASVPFWTWIAHMTSKHRAWIIAMLWACAIFPAVPWIVGPGDIEIFLVICVLTGFALGADLALPASMQADVIDRDTAACGDQRAGLFFAVWGLATKLALAMAALAFPLLLALGFDPRNTAHSDEALFALAAVYSFVPVLFKLVAIALMWGYPIDAKDQAATRRAIEERLGAR